MRVRPGGLLWVLAGLPVTSSCGGSVVETSIADGGSASSSGSSGSSGPGPSSGSGSGGTTSSGTTVAGASGAGPAGTGTPGTAGAFVQASLGPGTSAGYNDATACGMQGDLTWLVGSAVSLKPVTRLDGQAQTGGTVHVFCAVDPGGSGFNVNLSAHLTGTGGGSVSISGFVDPSLTLSTGLRGVFAAGGQQFQSSNCGFTQKYNGAPLPAVGQPAKGRIWGHISCPFATEAGASGAGASGSAVVRTCAGDADFLFENCN